MGKNTRQIRVRDLLIGGGAPVSVQSMCATPTRRTEDTLAQVEALWKAGADLIRVAVDNASDVASLKEIRRQTKARLVVDLQENFPLARAIAPHVDKIRYNPGHLHHLEKDRPIEDKVAFLVSIAKEHGLALRVGVNCGSVAPFFLEKFPDDPERAIVESALFHCDLLDGLKFSDYVVSIKDSDPLRVIARNREFSARRPDVPLHLGVTEAGMPPDGVLKTRVALEGLIPLGIGDTLRVSLTVRNEDKSEEVVWGRRILKDIAEGRLTGASVPLGKLNIISCPSCSRVENGEFVKLAEAVKEATAYAADHPVTIAVMGCRVNGPGETDHADLGLWCGPNHVTLKRKDKILGSFGYSEVTAALVRELDRLIGRSA